jgi:hypothetical protein
MSEIKVTDSALVDFLSTYLHLSYTDHDDPKSGISSDCPKCRKVATEIAHMLLVGLGVRS